MSRLVTLPVPFQLASSWTPSLQRDLRGWLWSEKLDGVRAMWDGRGSLISRNGRILKAPSEFTASLPRGIVLDGELWVDRGMFSDTVSVLRTKDTWSSLVHFKIFDVWDKKLKATGYSERMDRFEKTGFLRNCETHISLHSSIPLQKSCITDLLSTIIEQGGEGLILRDPGAPYQPGRRAASKSCMLKVKPFLDAEAEVLDVGLIQGRKGSITVKDTDGRIFKIASGFRDTKSEAPPSVGDIITFGYTSRFESSGIPRFPRYIRNRTDIVL